MHVRALCHCQCDAAACAAQNETRYANGSVDASKYTRIAMFIAGTNILSRAYRDVSCKYSLRGTNTSVVVLAEPGLPEFQAVGNLTCMVPPLDPGVYVVTFTINRGIGGDSVQARVLCICLVSFPSPWGQFLLCRGSGLLWGCQWVRMAVHCRRLPQGVCSTLQQRLLSGVRHRPNGRHQWCVVDACGSGIVDVGRVPDVSVSIPLFRLVHRLLSELHPRHVQHQEGPRLCAVSKLVDNASVRLVVHHQLRVLARLFHTV